MAAGLINNQMHFKGWIVEYSDSRIVFAIGVLMDAGLSKLTCCGSKWPATFSSALATLLASHLTLQKKMTKSATYSNNITVFFKTLWLKYGHKTSGANLQINLHVT